MRGDGEPAGRRVEPRDVEHFPDAEREAHGDVRSATRGLGKAQWPLKEAKTQGMRFLEWTTAPMTDSPCSARGATMVTDLPEMMLRVGLSFTMNREEQQ